MNLLTLSLLVLAGCAAPSADLPDHLSSSSVSPDGLDVYELSRTDVRGTAMAIAMLSDDLRGVEPEAKAQAVQSLRVLSVNCPYTRSAMQLPFALHEVVVDVDPMRLDPFIQKDWKYLQKGLSAHVQLLNSLHVDLPAPRPGDHLYGREPGLMVGVDALLASDDPLAVTAALIDEIIPLAEQIDEPTMEMIELHSERMETATGIVRPCPRGPFSTRPGHAWTLGMQLGGWHDALRRMRPFVRDPEVKRRVDSMIDVLEANSLATYDGP